MLAGFLAEAAFFSSKPGLSSSSSFLDFSSFFEVSFLGGGVAGSFVFLKDVVFLIFEVEGALAFDAIFFSGFVVTTKSSLSSSSEIKFLSLDDAVLELDGFEAILLFAILIGDLLVAEVGWF